MKRMPFFLFVFVGLTFVTIGCGGGAEPAAEGEAAPAEATSAAAAPAEAAETPAASTPEKSSAADSADAAVMAVVQGLQNNKAEALWEALPGSYQKDVNDLIHVFAANSDAELWGRNFATLKKLVNVLKSKKEFILNSPMFQRPGTKTEELAANWDQGVAFLETIVNSEISEIEKVKTLDAGKFLSGTGNNLLKQFRALLALSPNNQNPFDKLAQTKATLVKSDGDTATVKITMPGQPPADRDFVRVEGKWIPKDIADKWDERIANAKAALTAVPPEVKQQQKQMTLGMLDSVDATLDQLAAAESQQQFNTAFQQGIQQVSASAMMLMATLQGGLGGATPGPALPTPGGTAGPNLGAPKIDSGPGAQVIVKGDYLAKLSEINTALKKAVPEGSQINPIPGEGMITFGVSSVSDLQALADQLKFGKVTVNADKRTITIEVSAP